MISRTIPRLLIALAVLLSAGSIAAFGQGLILPEPPIGRDRPIRIQPFYVKNLRVNATITDNIAETVVEQTFVNDSSIEQEGTYLFPLPEGATALGVLHDRRRQNPRTQNPHQRGSACHL